MNLKQTDLHSFVLVINKYPILIREKTKEKNLAFTKAFYPTALAVSSSMPSNGGLDLFLLHCNSIFLRQ